MTPAQMLLVEANLAEINAELARHKATMEGLRSKLLLNARNFDTYIEMYRFVKKHTPSLEAFNTDMWEIGERKLFDK